jgi:hypothetical protein
MIYFVYFCPRYAKDNNYYIIGFGGCQLPHQADGDKRTCHSGATC